MDYPWLQAVLDHLVELKAAGRLPHALLLSGPAGTGKLDMAHQFAAVMLCATPVNHQPCGQCPSCTQLLAGSNPDYHFITYGVDEKTGKQKTAIVVDQVRALIDRLALGSHAGGMKVVIIAPADVMNKSASNSLLKTLEEPSDNTVLVLVSDRPAKLSATIRSRCQQIRVEKPSREQSLQWLAGQVEDITLAAQSLDVASGAPLTALALAGTDVMDQRRERAQQLERLLTGTDNAIVVAREWSEDENLSGIRWLRDWIMDLLRMAMTGEQAMARNSDVSDILASLVGRLNVKRLFQQLDAINRLLKADGTSLNRQLMAEDILLAWAGN